VVDIIIKTNQRHLSWSRRHLIVNGFLKIFDEHFMVDSAKNMTEITLL